MRNLKKVMALALATVMLFGMMVMGAGAADYKDADQIDAKYATATDLLYAIGAFQGTPEGNLNPQSTLTRAEAAVSIAKLALTKDVAANLAAVDTGFADVDASYAWAAGAIAYAKKLEIVSGVGDGKFDPAGTLTGLQYAKMLLVVLGYDPVAEGYTNNANWAANIDFDALQAGLKKGLSIDLSQVITREQAIQMAANALLADCVWYKTAGSSIVLPDGTTINNGGSAAEKVAAEKTDDYRNDGQDEKLQLIEKLYPTFKLTVDDADALGYAQKTWKNGTVEVATAANYTVLKTYTGKLSDVTYGKIYTDIGVKTSADVYVNYIGGEKLGTVSIEKDATGYISADYNGLTMKVVKNADAYAIVIEKATLAKVDSIKETKTEGKKAVLTVTDKDSKAYEIAAGTYAKGDLVVVTTNKANTKILSAKAATVISGLVTEMNKDGSVVTVDGVSYTIAGKEAKLGAVDATLKIDGTTKYNFVVEGGYIVAQTDVKGTATKASLTNVYYLADYTAVAADAWGVPTQYAQVISMADGTVSLVKIEVKVDAETGEYVAPAWAVDALYTKTAVTGKDYFTFAAFTGISKDADGKETQTIFWTTLNDAELKAADKSIETAAGKAYLTSASAILNITGNDATLAAKYVAGPFDVKLSDAQKAAANLVVYTKTATNAFEAQVIVLKGTLGANEVTGAAYYVLEGDLGKVYNAESKKTYTKVEVIDLATFEKFTANTTTVVVGYAKGTVDKYGAYTFKTEDATPSTAVPVTGGTATLYNNYLTAGGKEDYDVTNAKVINYVGAKVKDSTTVNVTTVAELVAAGHSFVMNVNNTAKTVSYIIITK